MARRRTKRVEVGRWLPYLASAPLLGVVGLVLYSYSVDSGSVLAVSLLVAGAAFLGGGLLGFLFGIPRSLAGQGDSAEGALLAPGGTTGPALYRSNTNLEQISDWLTKILVGVGLVQLGKLGSETRKLVDFLAPALGDAPSSPAYALAVLVLYAVSGFMIVYLVTRVYLGRVFAEADDLMRYVDQRIDEVRESQREQAEHDVHALAIVNRHLEPEGGQPELDQSALDAAIADASPLVRAQIFGRAREQRRRGDPKQVARTIGIFGALAAADSERRFHRNHAQLAYALKDKIPPDLVAAVNELDRAIEIRDRLGESGSLLYEFNRALGRIGMDPAATTNDATADDLRDRIVADLTRARKSRFLLRQIERNDEIKAWLKRNKLKLPDLT